jgi:hypothetical protein
MTEPIRIPPKRKYLVDSPGKSGGAYRARTGPRCCNDGCPARRQGGVDWRKHTGTGKR